jgi:hypothetical protein
MNCVVILINYMLFFYCVNTFMEYISMAFLQELIYKSYQHKFYKILSC